MKKIYFFSIFLSVTALASSSFADNLNITINPLLNYHQQLKQLKKECDAAGFPEECKTRFEQMSKEIDTLKKHCHKNPDDFRCDSLEKKSTERKDPLEEACSNDAYSTKCIRKKEEIRFNTLQLAKYCKQRPESSRCKPKPVAQKKEPYIVTFCRKFPSKKMCITYNETERLKKDPYYRSDRANTF